MLERFTLNGTAAPADPLTAVRDRPEAPTAAAPLEPLLTPDEAAAVLRISLRKLWGLTATAALPCVKIGRRKLYDPADIRDFIEAMKR